MKLILVVGDVYSETQFFTETIPQENEFAFASEAVSTIGSKAINVARVLAKLDNRVSFFGMVGKDPEGQQAITSLNNFRIIPIITENSSESTGKIAVITPKSGKSAIILSAGANPSLTPEIIRTLEPHIIKSDCVYTSTALPLNSLYLLAEMCYLNAVPIFLDIPNQQSILDLDKLAHVTFFMPNRQEASLLTSMPTNTVDEVMLVAKKLRQNIQGTIIITLDKDGCVLLNTNEDNDPSPLN